MSELIGIAGGIGSGKSYVSQILRTLGYKVYDCDLEARNIMDRSESIKRAIAEKMGTECVDEKGSIVRPAVAQRVFADAEQRLWLNALVHGAVGKDVKDWWKRYSEEGEKTVFVESAILATSGLMDMCDKVWLVAAPEDVRISRVAERSGLSREEILSRMKSQESENELLQTVATEDNKEIIVLQNDGVQPILHNIKVLIKN